MHLQVFPACSPAKRVSSQGKQLPNANGVGVLQKEVARLAVIYVQSKDGKPLMPTTRGGHVRHLLKTNQARVVERYPFTIRLLYDTEGVTQPLYLGIDPGRTNIGVTVVREDGEAVFSAQLETRNKEIPKLMAVRKAYRQAHRKLNRRDKRRRRARAAGTAAAPIIKRRLPGCEEPIQCHDIHNKEARFNNRCRADDWLTPTANHLLQTHLNLIGRLVGGGDCIRYISLAGAAAPCKI